MAITDNIAASWSLDNALTDASGNGNTLTNINTVNINATGIVNQGADFELASTQYLYCEDSASLSITGNISISLWFKWESHTDNVSFVAKADRTDRIPFDYKFYWETDNTLRFRYSASGDHASVTLLSASFTPSDATWYHLVVTVDVSAKTATFYVDTAATAGTQLATAAASISDSDVQTILGTDGGGNYLDGIADIVTIWSRILTSGEVSTLYNGGAGIQYPFGATTSANHSLLMGV